MGGKKLICESDVLAMAPGEVLHVDSATIATPAALDAAHARGVRIVHGDGGGCGSSFPRKTGKRECLWHGMLARGGTFVVQIENGRARVTKLTDGGPIHYGEDSAEEHNG